MSWSYLTRDASEVATSIFTGWYCMDCKIKADYDILTHKAYCFKCGNEWPARFLAVDTPKAKCQPRTTLYIKARDYDDLVKKLKNRRWIYHDMQNRETKSSFLKNVKDRWPVVYEEAPLQSSKGLIK